MAYREYRDARARLHRVDGPAIVSEEREEWWVDGRRHCDDGPAVRTKLGTTIYYWRGTPVPKDVIMNPKSKTPAEIFKIENIEIRRSWMESFGMEEFMDAMNPKVLEDDKKNERMLVSLKVPGEDEPMVMVKVKNSTPEGKWRGGADCAKCSKTGYVRHEESTAKEEVMRTCPACQGKGRTKMDFVPELKNGKEWFKHYYLRVPPTTKTCQDGVAWTFGFEKGVDYKPEMET